jgi:hypothetical protein
VLAGVGVNSQLREDDLFMISLGLRYDWQTYIETLSNFAPRVSLAYALEGAQDRVPRRLWHLLRPLWRATDLGGKALQR